MECPRCHATLYRSRDEEAAGECLKCGTIYQPVVQDPQAEWEADRWAGHSGTGKRARGAKMANTQQLGKPNAHGITADGCDVAPSCLDCPLPECKYVTNERTEPMNEATDANAMTQAEPKFRTLSTDELGRQCVLSLRELQRAHANAIDQLTRIQTEAGRLVQIAQFTGHEVPDDLRQLAGKIKPAAAPVAKVPCPECGHPCKGENGLIIHQARAHRPA